MEDGRRKKRRTDELRASSFLTEGFVVPTADGEHWILNKGN